MNVLQRIPKGLLTTIFLGSAMDLKAPNFFRNLLLYLEGID